MQHRTPLQVLQELAHERVDEATRKLGELIASEHAGEVKLQMLQKYRQEYRDRFLQAARGGIDPGGWANYSAFLVKLDEAISAQQVVLEHSRHATARGQREWASEHTRAKAFDTLTERQHRQEQHRLNKREQAQSDEHAIKAYTRGLQENS
ncbi:MAG: flagellar export protein FliJ [Candidatus Dactylopiibacterium carminicum]|uniref:Flagellar FliJ protein n=1 Tax=Candidatus Dactylopiibacterium carminicum TaxID=857335 RepID=A0A272ER81_9RHOO|nr:flagellar export protein FliJ [Candidatus Dactylopiibacterium carminicum]KAF7598676.1 flagellar export protein FliJ [Candidatus Dactylopiibacterium carminicum]PAS92566.1 MAG: flagellar export protein FliJ [Candidatus Dactylopiibacterium carminicum]PAS96075.1 MAG: flagellar export protein FliJ [Candidatus Dactylopiibacterium carminicum]PAS98543.1 MAG: flagellar export protein FliJ [Candidatus Dactylopiibacterium carminicum]